MLDSILLFSFSFVFISLLRHHCITNFPFNAYLFFQFYYFAGPRKFKCFLLYHIHSHSLLVEICETVTVVGSVFTAYKMITTLILTHDRSFLLLQTAASLPLCKASSTLSRCLTNRLPSSQGSFSFMSGKSSRSLRSLEPRTTVKQKSSGSLDSIVLSVLAADFAKCSMTKVTISLAVVFDVIWRRTETPQVWAWW